MLRCDGDVLVLMQDVVKGVYDLKADFRSITNTEHLSRSKITHYKDLSSNFKLLLFAHSVQTDWATKTTQEYQMDQQSKNLANIVAKCKNY